MFVRESSAERYYLSFVQHCRSCLLPTAGRQRPLGRCGGVDDELPIRPNCVNVDAVLTARRCVDPQIIRSCCPTDPLRPLRQLINLFHSSGPLGHQHCCRFPLELTGPGKDWDSARMERFITFPQTFRPKGDVPMTARPLRARRHSDCGCVSLKKGSTDPAQRRGPCNSADRNFRDRGRWNPQTKANRSQKERPLPIAFTERGWRPQSGRFVSTISLVAPEPRLNSQGTFKTDYNFTRL